MSWIDTLEHPPALKYYPISWLELSTSGDISVYGEIPGLSSRLGRIGFTAIPLGDEHKLAVSVSGSFDGRRYRRDLSDYNTNNFSARVALGYRFRPALIGRIGGPSKRLPISPPRAATRGRLRFCRGERYGFQ